MSEFKKKTLIGISLFFLVFLSMNLLQAVQLNNTLIYTGILNQTNSSCVQETANVSTSCGGLNTGNYYADTGWFGTDYYKLYDNNYNTYMNPFPFQIATYIVNYTVPSFANNSNAVNQLKFKYETNNIDYITNISIPYSCVNKGKLTLLLNDSNGFNFVNFNCDWYCFNGSSFNKIWTINSNCHRVYEEGMVWNQNTTSNQLIINVTNDIYFNSVTINDTCISFDKLKSSETAVESVSFSLCDYFMNYNGIDLPYITTDGNKKTITSNLSTINANVIITLPNHVCNEVTKIIINSNEITGVDSKNLCNNLLTGYSMNLNNGLNDIIFTFGATVLNGSTDAISSIILKILIIILGLVLCASALGVFYLYAKNNYELISVEELVKKLIIFIIVEVLIIALISYIVTLV